MLCAGPLSDAATVVPARADTQTRAVQYTDYASTEAAPLRSLLPAALEGGTECSTLPERNAEYLEAAYWDRRFQHEEFYEWFKVALRSSC